MTEENKLAVKNYIEAVGQKFYDSLSKQDKEYLPKTFVGKSMEEIKRSQDTTEHQMKYYIRNNLTPERQHELFDLIDKSPHDALYHLRTLFMNMVLQIMGGIIPLKSATDHLGAMYISKLRHIALDADFPNIFWKSELDILLKDTKNQIYLRPLPYPHFYINKLVCFDKNTYGLGIMVSEGDYIGKSDEKEPLIDLIVPIVTIGKGFAKLETGIINGGSINHHTKVDDPISGLTAGDIKKMKKIIENITCNVIDFMNHPKVLLREYNSSNNEKRTLQGKFPIPISKEITVIDVLHRYIKENINNDNDDGKNRKELRRHMVRGHYMHFLNRQRFKNLYQKSVKDIQKGGYQISAHGIISVWKAPYLRGSGKIMKKLIQLK